MIIPALKKTYNNKLVLDIPAIEIPDGGITAICGHNGSGKSTIAKILSGVIKDDSGKSHHTGLKAGYMNQTSMGFRMSVKNNLLLNSDKKLSRSANQERADMLLDMIGLSDIASKNASRLSGGQTQRMSLARTLMKDYELLILDEPTASLDKEASICAEDMILRYKERTGCTVIIITHSSEQARRLADMVIILEDGTLKRTFTTD